MHLFPRNWISALLLVGTLTAHAEPLAPYQIVSGHLPPFTVDAGADTPGALGTLVQALAANLGEPPPLQFYPWPRAMALLSTQPRTLILPLNRTPEREPHYRWLVKLYRQHTVFIAPRALRANLDTMDAMRGLRIGTLRGSSGEGQLTARNFKHLVLANSVDDLARMLERDMVDAIYGGQIINQTALAARGLDRSKVKQGKSQGYGDLWLAGSLDFTEAEATRWQDAMKQLVHEGTYQRTLQRYGLTP